MRFTMVPFSTRVCSASVMLAVAWSSVGLGQETLAIRAAEDAASIAPQSSTTPTPVGTELRLSTPTDPAETESLPTLPKSEPAAEAPAVEQPAVEQPAVENPAPPTETVATTPPPTSVEPKQDSLLPVPDGHTDGDTPAHAPKVAAASFNGVTPGETTLDELYEAWGAPRQMSIAEGPKVHLYTVEPFNQVEVTFARDRVASVVIRLEESFPAKPLAEQLKLSTIRPVLVSNELGEILGQSYPERGVLFAFEPSETVGKASMAVAQIILEPVSAEPFVLRAETFLNSRLTESIRDLEQATKIDPMNAKTHWLKARALALQGRFVDALVAGEEAVRIEPDDPQYQVTYAQILGQMARFEDAIAEIEKALPKCSKRLHLKARALCLWGDLLSTGPSPDYAQAIEHHMEAVKIADPLAVNRHPAIRLAAKEVLIDAHLGAAHDIAWGDWNTKEEAVPRWLDRASAFAEELIANDGGSDEHRFRIAARALAAYVGVQGKLDPAEWTEEVIRVGSELIDNFGDSPRGQQLRWDLGLALYDAVQIYQMRSEHDIALRYGQQAVQFLEQGEEDPSNAYLMGRLYFRLGAIHAVGENDHQKAITWFEKAITVFEKDNSQVPLHEAGRLGETFVSMGVSFWQSEQRQKAVQLTERGVRHIETAVENGSVTITALEIPYSNLATMHRQLGQHAEADRFYEMAVRSKETTQQ